MKSWVGWLVVGALGVGAVVALQPDRTATVVRVIDSTAEAPDGTRGLDHIGRVIDATIVQARTSQGHVSSIPSGIGRYCASRPGSAAPSPC